MRITDVRTHVLLDPGYDVGATSSAQDTIVVEIETDEGIIGIGETDLNAWIARACIEAPGTHTMDRGLRSMLIGRDPLDPEAIWQDAVRRHGDDRPPRRAVQRDRRASTSRSGTSAGKAAGVPSWQLLGEQARERADAVRVAAARGVVVRRLRRVDDGLGDTRPRDSASRAAKLEATFSGPYAHKGLRGPDEWIVEVVRAVREAAGPEMTLMVDVQYAFDSVERALRAAEAIAELRRLLPRDAALGRRPRRATPSSPRRSPVRDRAGRVADDPPRVRRR